MLWLPEWGKGKGKLKFAEAVGQAARYYKQKLGCWPTCCHVRPKDMPSGMVLVNGVEIKANESITPNHLFLTKEETNG
jgi:hypothetical protein